MYDSVPLAFSFLFNLWLDSVRTCFPVKPEKEGLLCASVFAFVLFLSLLLSSIKKLSNSRLLPSARVSVWFCLLVHQGVPQCWPALEGWFRMLLRAAGPTGSLIFQISWETCPSRLFVCICNSLERESLWCLWDFLLDNFRTDNSPKSLLPSDNSL